MNEISIIYFSGSGHTAQLAEAVRKGAESVPVAKVHSIHLNAADIIKGRYNNEDVMSLLEISDAIIFGCPTYMGGPAAQFKAFADATVERWLAQKWRDKFAAGFTVSGAPSGDKFNTL